MQTVYLKNVIPVPISIRAKHTIHIQCGNMRANITVTPVAMHISPRIFLVPLFIVPPPIYLHIYIIFMLMIFDTTKKGPSGPYYLLIYILIDNHFLDLFYSYYLS